MHFFQAKHIGIDKLVDSNFIKLIFFSYSILTFNIKFYYWLSISIADDETSMSVFLIVHVRVRVYMHLHIALNRRKINLANIINN
jgi:hypothetical protein